MTLKLTRLFLLVPTLFQLGCVDLPSVNLSADRGPASSDLAQALGLAAGGSAFRLKIGAIGLPGSGTVASAPGTILCEAGETAQGCSGTFAGGATVVLTATPSQGKAFKTWGGDCAGLETTCTLTLDSDKTVTAEFESADLSVPTVTAVSPAQDSSHVSVDAVATVTFSEAMDPSTINMASVYLTDVDSGTKVPSQVTYSNGIASIRPSSPLAHHARYEGGVTPTARSLGGIALDQERSWTFTTE